MKPANVIWRGFMLCFFAISAALLLSAAIWGVAISFALSYVIAPWQSHIFILCNSLVCSFILVSLCPDFTVGRFILQGGMGKISQKETAWKTVIKRGGKAK